MKTVDVEQFRPRLLGIAYRILGSFSDAEDAVQDAYLRWQRIPQYEIRSPEAWLVTVVTRLSIDRLRVLERERLDYTGTWLPEPVADDGNPELRAEMAEDLTIAFLVVLQRLSPEERAAFILREVLNYPYAEIAQTLEKSEDACRQLVHRAKVAVHSDRKRRQDVSFEERERIAGRLVEAMSAGDEAALLQLIAPEAVFASDSGGKVAAAANVLKGIDVIGKFLIGLRKKFFTGVTLRVREILAEPVVAIYKDGHLIAILALDTDGERISGFYNILNPDKLRHVESVRSN